MIYAYDSVMRVSDALVDLTTLQVEALQIEGLLNDLKAQFALIKETFADLGGIFNSIEQTFSSIFATFGVLRSILGPVCAVTKVSGNAISGVASGIGNLGGVFKL